ncbi:MAG: hypothetical protein Q7J28_02685 [Caulobacter sp.]|nr:hypothetical protein [Caulobacter sp.]
MKARPILFSAPMVRALLAGTKTQTRRVVKPQPDSVKALGRDDALVPYRVAAPPADMPSARMEVPILCPYGQPGDLLYVRETWAADGQGGVRYYATDDVHDLRRKRVSIHMPRWASRLTLEITDVRVERLQDISEADALAEGIQRWPDGRFAGDDHDPDPNRLAATSAVGAYSLLWTHINGPGSWDANPFVWAVSFRVHRTNVDQVLTHLGAAA